MSDLERSLASDFQQYIDRSGYGLRRGASALADYLEQGTRAAFPGIYGEPTLADRLIESQNGLADAFRQGGRAGFDYMLNNPQYQRAMADVGGAFVGSMGSVAKPKLAELTMERLRNGLPDTPRVPVHLIERAGGGQEFTVLPDGRAALYVHPSWRVGGKSDLEARMFRDIARYMNPMPENTYFRMHHNPSDYLHLERGTHRGSRNWATGEDEGGLSVSLYPGDRNADYGYFVRGEQIGTGSDGEPLLNAVTARPASRMMSGGEALDEFRRMQREWADRNGFTDNEVTALRTARQLVSDGPKSAPSGLLADLLNRR